MEMDDATATTAGAGCEGEQRPPLQPHTRIDWRTGRPMLVHGAAFWKEHAARRMEQGLSVAAYCEANGLAKSTFRRHACAGGVGGSQRAGAAPGRVPAESSRFVPLHGTSAPAEALVVELETGDGMKLRLVGSAAERLMQHVLAKLA
nr:hypothetical protein [uncultured Caldimonas sp.]